MASQFQGRSRGLVPRFPSLALACCHIISDGDTRASAQKCTHKRHKSQDFLAVFPFLRRKTTVFRLCTNYSHHFGQVKERWF